MHFKVVKPIISHFLQVSLDVSFDRWVFVEVFWMEVMHADLVVVAVTIYVDRIVAHFPLDNHPFAFKPDLVLHQLKA